MIVLPRRFGKTLLASIFLVWYCLKYPNRNVLLVTDVLTKAKSIVKSVKSIISTNKNIKMIFGNNLLTKNGNDSGKMTLKTRQTGKKEPNILAYSMLQTPQSLRADLVMFEDVISHNYKTSRLIKKKTDENFEAIIPILEKDAKIIYIGTRFHYDDIPAQIKRQNLVTNKWRIIEESAEDVNGKARYPDILDDEELSSLRNSMAMSFYSSQYLNRPMSKEECLFKLELYSYYKQVPERNTLDKIIMGVDLAFSTKENADTRAIAVIGIDTKGVIYLLDAYESREEIDLFYTKIKDMYLKWSANRVYVETNSAFRVVYDSYVKRSMEDRSYIPFSPIVNTKNKALRFELTLLPLLQTGALMLPSRQIITEENALYKLTMREMAYFNPLSENNKDDLIDALEVACSNINTTTVGINYKIGGELRTSSLEDWY